MLFPAREPFGDRGQLLLAGNIMAQLATLVGPHHSIMENSTNFITNAFKPRRGTDAHEIARKAKIRRLERRRPTSASMPLQNAVAELTIVN